MDIIAYNYYRGMLFTGLKRFDDAMECFKLAISAPTALMHKIFTEAYKKLFLLSLLTFGTPPQLPPYVFSYCKIKFEHQFDLYKNLEKYYNEVFPSLFL